MDSRPSAPLDLTKGKYWVTKLPAYVYDAWQQASNERQHFADIHIQTTGPVKRMRLTLRDPEPGAPASVPVSIKNPKEKALPLTYVFSELSTPATKAPAAPPVTGSSRYVESNRRFKIEDQVKGIVELKPDDTAEYREFNLNRLRRKQEEITSNVSVPEFKDDIDMMTNSHVFQDAATIRKADKKEAASKTDKRSRADGKDVYAMLIRLFGMKSQWTFQELVQHTEQPKNHLQDILKIYCNKNEDNRTFSLKPKEDILLR